jgi:hypothetical protein
VGLLLAAKHVNIEYSGMARCVLFLRSDIYDALTFGVVVADSHGVVVGDHFAVTQRLRGSDAGFFATRDFRLLDELTLSCERALLLLGRSSLPDATRDEVSSQVTRVLDHARDRHERLRGRCEDRRVGLRRHGRQLPGQPRQSTHRIRHPRRGRHPAADRRRSAKPVKTSRMFPCYLYFPGFRAISSRFTRIRFPFSASQLPQIHSGGIGSSAPRKPRKPSAEDVAVKRPSRKSPPERFGCSGWTLTLSR